MEEITCNKPMIVTRLYRYNSWHSQKCIYLFQIWNISPLKRIWNKIFCSKEMTSSPGAGFRNDYLREDSLLWNINIKPKARCKITFSASLFCRNAVCSHADVKVQCPFSTRVSLIEAMKRQLRPELSGCVSIAKWWTQHRVRTWAGWL